MWNFVVASQAIHQVGMCDDPAEASPISDQLTLFKCMGQDTGENQSNKQHCHAIVNESN